MVVFFVSLRIIDSAANHLRISVLRNVGGHALRCLCTFGNIEEIHRPQVAAHNLLSLIEFAS